MSREHSIKILVVDDDPAVRRLSAAVLARRYNVREAADGEQAIQIARRWHPDVVLMDLLLPGINGHETCQRLRAELSPPPQIILVSAQLRAQIAADAIETSFDDILAKPIDPVALRASIAARLAAELPPVPLRRLPDAEDSLEDVAVFTLAKVAESRDYDTGQHLERMREYTQILAQWLAEHGRYDDEIDTAFLQSLYRSSPLHDIGKVGIRDAVLLKPGPLTTDEFEAMKQHTILGANLLQDAVLRAGGGGGFLAMGAWIAQYHHERWDGTGYLAGLAGTEIPLAARIVAVADVFDALTSERPYKAAWTAALARETILSQSGRQFDPLVVTAFEASFEEFQGVRVRSHCTLPSARGAMKFAGLAVEGAGRA